MAANSLWCFLVPLVVVLCTVSAVSINSQEEFVNPIPLSRATEVGNFCPKNEEFVKCEAKYELDCGKSPISKSDCVSGCRCKSGYVRGPRGTCIKKEECPKNDTTSYPVERICPKNERWNRYIAHCQRNCTQTKSPSCARVAVAGCICMRGFLRRDNGKCVPRIRCRKNADPEEWGQKPLKTFCPPNEFFASCIGHCEPDCKNKTKTLQDCNKSICVSECRCQWGFVRGPQGNCIKPDKCPAKDKTKYPVKRKCPAKEQWETNRAHCQTNCTTIGKKVPCTKIAVAGCVCKKDTYRAKNGECVPKKQCSKKADEFDVSTEDDFEAEISTEEPSWRHRTDDEDNEENSWDDHDDDHDEKRGDEDDARAKSYCPANEFFAPCTGHCEPDCKNKDRTPHQDCPKGFCVSECRCKVGFVRGPKGVCIKPDKCPAKDNTKYPVKRKCPAKEQWDTTAAHCQTNCTTIGKIIPCFRIAVPGCVCKKDTYRAKNGECVPKKQCSKKADEPEDSWNHNEDLRTESTNVDEEYYSEVKKERIEEVLEGPGGCPSDRKCTRYCRSQGKKYGRCIGRHRRRCTCRS